MPARKSLLSLVVSLTATLGCGAVTDPSVSAPDAAAPSCSGDPHALVYAPNLGRLGPNGVFIFILVKSDPAPPAKGLNTWTVKVVDARYRPVVGAMLSVVPYQNEKPNGAMIPMVNGPGDGTFTVDLDFFQAGLWRIDMSAGFVGGLSDGTSFFFCIDG